MHTAAIVFRDGVTRIFEVNSNERLLDAAFRNGVSLPLDCREGVCATCRGLCESGKIEMDYVDEDALSESEIASGYVLSCQTTLQSAASFYFDIDSSVCNVSVRTFDGTVSSLEKVSDAAMIMEVTLDDLAGVSYLPGQYAHIYIPDTEEHRAYSFATAKAVDGKLRFLMRLLPDGVMSNYLRDRCQLGDKLKLELPYGAFYLREIEKPLLLIAGGTGLSAILGMLDQLAESEGRNLPIRVIYGARKEEDLSELNRLEAYRSIFSNYHFEIILSDAVDTWTGKRGYVTDCIMDCQFTTPFDAYLCGPPAMIEASEAWLKAAHLEKAIGDYQLYFERFVSS
ncbi:anthranilate 1,2-dioxygenase electron transfer component AntC [Ignatzschineria rhizosphaerae]|uniref:Anthranilate 1,2-dioxygenase electron transfer component AntC n=1 Tax=Ignatzschineria rhizosphaerae TaxID=2923279 RepID=A0ABY3X4N4_9GAMM|nr:anthranilate 1,2-dioxygenase electron transfer component AntC [Ignatzschineria rhizosphaerae]UNM96422.1 anthranilate 1,2-dioxygenase electron transfer component AntC [Ignatzschineria rhizosphaerae]